MYMCQLSSNSINTIHMYTCYIEIDIICENLMSSDQNAGGHIS